MSQAAGRTIIFSIAGGALLTLIMIAIADPAIAESAIPGSFDRGLPVDGQVSEGLIAALKAAKP